VSRILVTGGSGFVASHCILQALAAGHEVRTTVRDPGRRKQLEAKLRQGGLGEGAALAFAVADLTADAGWAEATAGCDAVLHIASPFPASQPKNEEELILPAREGTLRVLRAARAAGVRRVVMTSSFGAIGYGHPPRTEPFTERDWTQVDSADVQPYVKSKTLAERAAWDFIADEGGDLELAVINPTGIFGPVLGPGLSGSVSIIKRMLEGRMPVAPRIYCGVVDVRDVADLHLRALAATAAAGQRYLAVAGPALSLLEVAAALKRGLGHAARKAPSHQLPDWLVRIAAWRSPAMKAMLPQLGKVRNASADKARRELGWIPRPAGEALAATGESLIRLGLVNG